MADNIIVNGWPLSVAVDGILSYLQLYPYYSIIDGYILKLQKNYE